MPFYYTPQYTNRYVCIQKELWCINRKKPSLKLWTKSENSGSFFCWKKTIKFLPAIHTLFNPIATLSCTDHWTAGRVEFYTAYYYIDRGLPQYSFPSKTLNIHLVLLFQWYPNILTSAVLKIASFLSHPCAKNSEYLKLPKNFSDQLQTYHSCPLKWYSTASRSFWLTVKRFWSCTDVGKFIKAYYGKRWSWEKCSSRCDRRWIFVRGCAINERAA